MTMPTEVPAVQPFYNGHDFPVDQLSPGKFEDFVFACLQSASNLFDLVITGQPSGSGDGGFDVQARNTLTGRIACIQCKRQKDPLGTPLVAEELAKVAATSALEGSNVGEHRFICTGGVRGKLVKQLRQKSRADLASEAVQRISTAKDGELAVLRARLEAATLDVGDVVNSYVKNLDVLLAWSFHEFDVALSPRWNAVLQISERFFSIASVVREHPRASFDRSAYVAEHRSYKTSLEPRLRATTLPAGITTSSAANPGTTISVAPVNITALDKFYELERGSLALLTGDGGTGKSAALKLIRARALQSSEAMLPIMLSLSTYVSGGLDYAIHQELGVESGSWRSLPDHVLLLCDGLNECPAVDVDAFLTELRPLLSRKRVSCVISTRESIGRVKIVLPQAPVACIGLDDITPRGIRRIAERELRDEDVDGFVAEYRALADVSNSRLLWTPFSVMVAVALWRLSSSLPHTLGEMLAALLRSRCDRNLELSQRQHSPEVVLLLSEAVAFQCLIVDGRLECPATEAGRWIREAKKFCGDALGISDLSETQAIELLIEHNLINRSQNGHFFFDHHLVAGALTAPLLSKNWREYVSHLEDTLSDDAWVFAARMVSPDDVADYLTTVFNRDLSLGTRVARELSPVHHAYAKALLDQCLHADSPEYVQINAVFALALLSSDEAVAKLKELVSDQQSPILHAARRALAATGDYEFLGEILKNVDTMRSTPFKMSGGEADIWDRAPLPKRLDVVRRRLASCSLGDAVSESLRLIAFERDPEDIPTIERHLEASRDISAWGNAIYALHIVAPERAKIAVQHGVSSVSSITGRARLLRIASLAGVPIDIDEAFRYSIAELPAEALDQRGDFDLISLISDVIDKTTLPSSLVNVVERELPDSVGNRRQRLWQIALGCNSTCIGDYALSRIVGWTQDVGNACRYFIEHPDLATAHRVQVIECCERAIKDEKNWYDWATAQALELLVQLGHSTSTATTLAVMLMRATRVTIAARTGISADLAPNDLALLHSLQSKHAITHLEFLIGPLIPVITRARSLLPPSALTCLLSFDYHVPKSTLSDLRLALSDLPDEVIDGELARVQDLSTLLSGLLIVCTRGATPTRLNLLELGLKASYCHPAGMHRIQQAIDACWCPDVLKMVLKFVADVEEWSEFDSQFFWECARQVARRVGDDDRVPIEEALRSAKTAFARRILTLWRSQTLGQRVGLSSLVPSN